ncbi:MAG: phosphopentomutase [Hydrogenoanaerobacterium sp.]
MSKRVFLIVLDSVGIGELPDAAEFGDAGSNTVAACATSTRFNIPNMQKLGFFNIDGVSCRESVKAPVGSFCRLAESSRGKDTTIGHWEISGIISPKPLPTFPEGFPPKIIAEFEKLTGRKTICNKPYSGTQVLEDYGEEHLKTGALIVYTSADSVFQVAAHEGLVPIAELYKDCQIARDLLVGECGVGRVIARPFVGEAGSFKRTTNRHDYSLAPPRKTMLTALQAAGLASIGVGKIYDIFDGVGVDSRLPITSNTDGMNKTIEIESTQSFNGLCFVNLVDFDMVYGHRNDIDGYAQALTDFDVQLGEFIKAMGENDILFITADHGCDPSTPSTDHSREYIPLLAYGAGVKGGVNLGTRPTFSDIGATVLDIFGVKGDIDGESFWNKIKK